MSVKIDIKGHMSALEDPGEMIQAFDEELTRAMNDEGLEWRDDARANTPVDTGALRQAMVYEKTIRTPEGLEMKLVNQTEYASHVEYGHRTRGGKGYVPGVYMMKNATIRLEQRMPGALRKAAAKITRRING